MTSSTPRRRVRGLLLSAVLLSACTSPPIDWDSPEYSAPGSPMTVAVTDDLLCGVAESGLGGTRFRAGWSRDGGGLAVRKSEDGGVTWEPPVIADARPQETRACDRLPPAVFADSGNNFLHVAFFADVPGGAGVYYVHSMNAARVAQRGEGMFEVPIALTYGTRPVRTAVASRGDTVIVALEDPNSPRGGIQLALSHTAGHSFDTRVPVSSSAGAEPEVWLSAGAVTVGWRETGAAGRTLSRRGRFR